MSDLSINIERNGKVEPTDSELLAGYIEAARILIEQYEAEDDYKMGGKLTNKPFLMFKELLAKRVRQ
jgi:hypothetical protein